MRIAICDDERKFIKDFQEIMDRSYQSLDMRTDEYTSGVELLKSFQTSRYDIVFLDIEMPGMDGISLARKLRAMSEEVYIIFLTGHIEYALKGYEVNALRFLTKPVTEDNVREIIEYVLKKQTSGKFLWISNWEGEQRVKYSDIIYLEAQNQNIVIVTAEKSYEIRANFNDYEKKLAPDGFYRVHRSYIVALSKVMMVSGKEITVAGGFKIPIARAREAGFKSAFMSYIGREAF